MLTSSAALPPTRLNRIARARQLALDEQTAVSSDLVEPWIAQSWQRCLGQGQRPGQRVSFDAVSERVMRDAAEANHQLVQAARPVLSQLGQALVDTRYFAILTNRDGVVVDVDGPIDRDDRRASVITRVGVDLSERSIGTSAIGTALNELRPVWLHRGEHFFTDTSVYSCAGAPLFGPDGRCIGMLDLTGIEAPERPELRHLVTHYARRIENALVLQRPHQLLLRLNWPGQALGDHADGLITLDPDGALVAANQAARQLLPELAGKAAEGLHSRDLFAMPFEMLFDAARHGKDGIDAPLWSGLRLRVMASRVGQAAPDASNAHWPATAGSPSARPLREVEEALIHKAVEEARGNVAQAARRLGISRATIYRKLGKRG